jgi:glyoxylase-like metal-dependent hydrolase (beta-lactamase superfamily II)
MMIRLPRLRATLLAAAVAATLSAASGPAPAQPVIQPGPQRLVLRQLAPNVYWSKEGGQAAVVVGPTGVIVFDVTVNPARARELQARIAEVTDKPIVAVILSHVDEDHVGGLSGFPADVPVYAHPRTRALIKADAEAGKGPIPADRVPGHAVGQTTTLTLGGEPVRIIANGPAHTDGDLVVYLPRERVVLAGDIFCMDQPRPYIKPELAGSAAGWVKTAALIVKLNPQWVVVGHGEPQKPGNLKAFIADAATERAAIVKAARAGKSMDEAEALAGEPQPSKVPLKPGQHLAQYGRAVYLEATGQKAPAPAH